MSMHSTQVVRELVPDGERGIHGVTFDGIRVWFARDDELLALDPATGTIVRRLEVKSAEGGTAFDGTHLYQLAKGRILVVDPETGRIVRELPAPAKGEDSGMAYADGYLWVGHYRGKKIHKVDARTGEVVKTLASDRFVTGVSCVGGELWHAAAGDDRPSELRRLADDGSVAESLHVPVPMISGMERTADGSFWCGGEQGRLRLVKKA